MNLECCKCRGQTSLQTCQQRIRKYVAYATKHVLLDHLHHFSHLLTVGCKLSRFHQLHQMVEDAEQGIRICFVFMIHTVDACSEFGRSCDSKFGSFSTDPDVMR